MNTKQHHGPWTRPCASGRRIVAVAALLAAAAVVAACGDPTHETSTGPSSTPTSIQQPSGGPTTAPTVVEGSSSAIDLATLESWSGVVTATIGETVGSRAIEGPGDELTVTYCAATIDQVWSGSAIGVGDHVEVACAVSGSGGDRPSGYSLPEEPWETGTVVDLGLTTAPGYPGYVAEPVVVANGEIRVGDESASVSDFARRAAANPVAASRVEPEPVP